MAYSKTWVETDPIGSQITVSELDNWIRDTKIATRERLEVDGPLAGIFEVGSFDTAPIPALGSGRFHAGLLSALPGLGGTILQTGRGYFTTDNDPDRHPRLYHLEGAGAREIAYLNRDGSRTMVGTFYLDRTAVTVNTVLIEGAKVRLQIGNGVAVTDAVAMRVQPLLIGAGSTLNNNHGLYMDNIDTPGATNYAIKTHAGIVDFGGAFIRHDNGNVLLGLPGLALGATAGWPHLPQVGGTPTGGAAVNYANMSPVVYDSINFRLYIRTAAGWKFTQLA